MPSVQSVERVTRVLWADSQAVKTWRDKARVQAISALSLASNPDYIVYAVRNSKSLLGLAAIRVQEKYIYLLHLASRDHGRGVGTLLIETIQSEYSGIQMRTTPEESAVSFYEHLGWRKVGKEYWSK